VTDAVDRALEGGDVLVDGDRRELDRRVDDLSQLLVL